MVNLIGATWLLLAETPNNTVLEKLDPERRAAVVLALVGLSLVGVLLVVVAMLAGRWARHDRPRRETRFDKSATPNYHGDPQIPTTNDRRGETIVSEPGSEDTKV